MLDARAAKTASDGALLSGIRVLDFGRYIAGPYCAGLLSDLGAEVIRIEKVDGSEDRYILPTMPNGEGAVHLQMNRNKLSLTLNPKKPEGREVVQRLVMTADVVVANLPVNGLRAMGIDYESLKAIRPDIILSSLSAFGHRGPYMSRSGFDGIAQAMSGAVYMSGIDGQPVKSYASWCDFGTGLAAAYGTVAALLHRFRTGCGQMVSADLLRTAVNFFHFNNLEAYLKDRNRPRSGNRGQFGAPADLFRTLDGWIQAQVIGQTQFKRWCQLIGKSELVDDLRFQSDSDRAENGQLLNAHMQAWIGDLTTKKAMELLEKVGIPAGPMLSPTEVISDPHVLESGLISWIEYPGLTSPVPLANSPVELSAFDTQTRVRSPTLGEHTNEVLVSLGYSQEEITNMRRARVV